MDYISTRGSKKKVSASQAILNGPAEDGGLYAPEYFPKLDKCLEVLKDMNYQETAYEVMKLFLTDFTEEELKDCIRKAYDEKFDTPDMVKIEHKSGIHYLELFHGNTLAFKDMALSILPHLMVTSAKKHGVKEKIVILTATSGDTGKAALASFADVEGTGIVVFYPEGGVSAFQKKQMVTQTGNNVRVAAIRGNFDDAQTGVKEIFLDKDFNEELKKKGILLSSANSINIGRLVPQIVYYVFAYTRLMKEGKIAEGEEIDVAVPTGNFGNILAAYYAKKIGLPIRTFLCASNENKVLFDFFTTGEYDKNRKFALTISPSMDILVSSNLERLIYALSGEDSKLTREYMEELFGKGSYTINEEMKKSLSDFVAGYATEEETLAAIKEEYEDTGYVIDPHTAVASHVAKAYQREEKEKRELLLASTASPFKFARSVLHALEPENFRKEEEGEEEWALISKLEERMKTERGENIRFLENLETRHKIIINKGEMRAEVLKMIENRGGL